MSLEIWGYIFGGATIFALIVGLFSVYNGRRTRRDIANLIEKMNELIRTETEKLSELIKTETEGLGQILSKISEQIAIQK